MKQNSELLKAVGICKSFGNTKAVTDFSFTINKGEIRGLVGENGSGKSTFSSVIAGIYPCDKGTVYLDGAEYHAKSIVEAAEQGIAIIMQEIATLESVSVAANLFLNDEAQFGKYGFRTVRSLNEAAKKIFEEYEINSIDPAALTSTLNLEQRKMIELARAMYKKPKLLIVDETSNALTRVGRVQLYNCIRRVISDGGAVLFITHECCTSW